MAVPSGNELPYKIVGGAVPCATGWLMVSAKMKGATFAPDFPRVADELVDIFHRRPPFSVIALNAPIGSPALALGGQRTCDIEGSTVLDTDIVFARWHGVTPRMADGLNADDDGSRLGERFSEVAREIAPYLQRKVYEVVPDLSFYQLNSEKPLEFHAASDEGYAERRELLTKVPGLPRILDADLPGVTQLELLESCALLWSARRISSRAAKRLPSLPEWDENGLRVDIVR
jgi:predicted RNase H-like nuclease